MFWTSPATMEPTPQVHRRRVPHGCGLLPLPGRKDSRVAMYLFDTAAVSDWLASRGQCEGSRRRRVAGQHPHRARGHHALVHGRSLGSILDGGAAASIEADPRFADLRGKDSPNMRSCSDAQPPVGVAQQARCQWAVNQCNRRPDHAPHEALVPAHCRKRHLPPVDTYQQVGVHER